MGHRRYNRNCIWFLLNFAMTPKLLEKLQLNVKDLTIKHRCKEKLRKVNKNLAFRIKSKREISVGKEKGVGGGNGRGKREERKRRRRKEMKWKEEEEEQEKEEKERRKERRKREKKRETGRKEAKEGGRELSSLLMRKGSESLGGQERRGS